MTRESNDCSGDDMNGKVVARDGVVLVLDVGKTHTRLVTCDGAGRVLETARRESRTSTAPPYPHLDVEESFDWMLGAIRDFEDRARIECVVPVAHGATAALMAGDELALPVVDYEWSGVEAVEPDYPRPAFEETRSPKLSAGLNLGRQLFHLARTHPQAWARITSVLLYPQFWAWRFSGQKASEVTSLGCHTDLWSPTLRRPSSLWSSPRSGLRPSLLPPIRSAWHALGPPTAEVCDRTGLPRDCRILCGIHDSNAAYFAHRALRREPFAVVSSGTWVVVMANGTDIARLDPGRDMLANVDAFGDPVATARFMGGREFEAIVGDLRRGTSATREDAARTIARGALALPAFADQGGPFAGRTGTLRGAKRLSGSERVALASIYLALQTDFDLDLLGARHELIVEGPLARNDVYLEVLASLRSDQTVLRSTDETGSLRGAVALAGWPRPPAPADLSRVDVAPMPGLAEYRAEWRRAVDTW